MQKGLAGKERSLPEGLVPVVSDEVTGGDTDVFGGDNLGFFGSRRHESALGEVVGPSEEAPRSPVNTECFCPLFTEIKCLNA